MCFCEECSVQCCQVWLWIKSAFPLVVLVVPVCRHIEIITQDYSVVINGRKHNWVEKVSFDIVTDYLRQILGFDS